MKGENVEELVRCEYCGMPNEISRRKCEYCGAPLPMRKRTISLGIIRPEEGYTCASGPLLEDRQGLCWR